MKNKIRIEPVVHRGQKRIKLIFKYNTELIQQVKQLPGCRWSQTMRCWHVPQSSNYPALLLEEPTDEIEVQNSKDTGAGLSCQGAVTSAADALHKDRVPDEVKNQDLAEPLKSIGKKPANTTEQIMQAYFDTMQIRRLSRFTCTTYSGFFSTYLQAHSGHDIKTFSYQQIDDYIKQRAQVLSDTQTRQMISAIKFYYERVLGYRRMFFNLGKEIQITPVPTHIEFFRLKNLLEPIRSPHDRLLLFLVFYNKLTPVTISKLGRGIDQFKHAEQFKKHAVAWSFFVELHRKHCQVLNPDRHLFERKGKPITAQDIRKKIHALLAYYHLDEIYKVQYQNALNQTDLSEGTRASYLSAVMQFIRFFRCKHPSEISHDDIKTYLVLQTRESSSKQNMVINSLKLYYKHVVRKPLPDLLMLRSKKEKYLPDVFSKEEIRAILAQYSNIKHKTLIALGYSAGLRRAEIQNLKIRDIRLDRKLIFIEQAKGKKDRYTFLSANLVEMLQVYLEACKPVTYLFEGRPGRVYSFTSMQNILKNAAEAAGIVRNVHLHMLRHSFATHLIEDGVDIRYVQQLLGHGSIKTTERYTHVAKRAIENISSPFDTGIFAAGIDSMNSRGPSP